MLHGTQNDNETGTHNGGPPMGPRRAGRPRQVPPREQLSWCGLGRCLCGLRAADVMQGEGHDAGCAQHLRGDGRGHLPAQAGAAARRPVAGREEPAQDGRFCNL